MSAGRWAFTPSEVQRGIAAAEKAGKSVRGIRYYRNGFTVLIGDGTLVDDAAPNEWDEVLRDGKDQAQVCK
jgi:hypothetical protein